MKKPFLLVVGIVLGSLFAWGADDEPVLNLVSNAQKIALSRSELLKSSDVETIVVPSDVSYLGQSRQFRAIPMDKLLGRLHLDADAVIQFKCSDGFSAVLSKDRLMNRDPEVSHAYLAIEDPKEPWPTLKPGGKSAGPFYLVWLQPELSKIMPDEWPNQISAFEVKGSLKSLYPKIFPAEKAGASVQRGFNAFARTCFSCHTLNLQGAAQVGPDLNVPMSPTQYMKESALRLYVRDPQKVRHWEGSRMMAFSTDTLPESTLSDIIAYLKYMAKTR